MIVILPGKGKVLLMVSTAFIEKVKPGKRQTPFIIYFAPRFLRITLTVKVNLKEN